jgi:hypothetical protein
MPPLRRFGADGPLWWRFGGERWSTLAEALDHPDGDQLLHTEQAVVRRAREQGEAERRPVERERRRPACARCRESFSDERWAEQEQAGAWGDDGLCAGCRQADVDQRGPPKRPSASRPRPQPRPQRRSAAARWNRS